MRDDEQKIRKKMSVQRKNLIYEGANGEPRFAWKPSADRIL
jgi:hypothetical protein